MKILDKPSATIGVSNDRKDGQPMTVWIEPIARDFTLVAGESLEILAYGRISPPRFDLNTFEEDLQICIDVDGPPVDDVAEQVAIASDFVVTQNGKQITCGHNREARPQ